MVYRNRNNFEIYEGGRVVDNVCCQSVSQPTAELESNRTKRSRGVSISMITNCDEVIDDRTLSEVSPFPLRMALSSTPSPPHLDTADRGETLRDGIKASGDYKRLD